MNLEKSLLNYVKKTIWKDDTDDEFLIKLSQKVFDDMKNGITKKKLLLRICGQSGSGKTTQALKSLETTCQNHNLNPINIAVRNFCKYHPLYESFIKSENKNEMREKTNGFALKLLSLVLVKFIKNGYFIIMDTTLLDKEFEDIINNCLTSESYKINYFILSVPKSVSDLLINKRQLNSNKGEIGRIVYKSSSDFFYTILEPSLNHLSQINKDSLAVVWSAFNLYPIYFGKLEFVMENFINGRKKIETNFPNEDQLLKSKIKFLEDNYKLLF